VRQLFGVLEVVLGQKAGIALGGGRAGTEVQDEVKPSQGAPLEGGHEVIGLQIVLEAQWHEVAPLLVLS